MTWKHFELTDEQGIMTIWLDVADSSQNVFRSDVMQELNDIVDEVNGNDSLKALIIRSRKPGSFVAGADIHELASIESLEQGQEKAKAGQNLFATIESLPVPTVALIEGVCLGGGMELALSCDYRIVVNTPKTRLGLPEVELGILPGWGGTQRLPPLIGAMPAIQMILQGRKHNAKKAYAHGLADLLVNNTDDIERQLNEFVKERIDHPSSSLKKKKPSFLTWFINRTSLGRMLLFRATRKRIKNQVRNYPALGKALEAIELSFKSGRKGFLFEQEAIAELLFTPTCKNLVRLFLLREQARSVETWKGDDGGKPNDVQTIAVIGGGIMGAGIAQTAAKTGFSVIIKEIHDDACEAAKARITKTLQSLVDRGSMSPALMQEQLQSIGFTTSWSDIADANLVIEAVPETMELKQQVFTELNAHCSSDAILATNTSALSVNEIAESIDSPNRVAGLHFFNPVHRMDLVEVIAGTNTEPWVKQTLVAVTKKLGKTPVIAQDSPGFIVNRILMPYLDEAVQLALELQLCQQHAEYMDRDLKRFGMPMGPLELLDQVGVDVAAHVASSMTIVFGENSPTATILSRMVEKEALGKKSKHGFYSYHQEKKSELVKLKDYAEGLDVTPMSPPATVLDERMNAYQQRLVLAMVNEAGRCLDEGVATESWMIDLAMVLGTGFAPFHGGPLKLAQDFGPDKVVETLNVLEEAYGPRYKPAESLSQLEPS